MTIQEEQKYNRGDIYYVKGAPSIGSEQNGDRPAIIVGNDKGNMHAPVVEIVYLTTKQKHMLPTHVPIFSSPRSSTALCEHVVTVSKDRLEQKLGTVSIDEMQKIDNALLIGLDLNKKEASAYVTITTGLANMTLQLGIEELLSTIQLLHESCQESGTAVIHMEAEVNGGPAHKMSFRMSQDSLAAAMRDIFLSASPLAESTEEADACGGAEETQQETPEEPWDEEDDFLPEEPETRPVHTAKTLYLGSDGRKGEAKEYKGFLMVKCRYCGEIRGFCASKPISEFMCHCGRNTSLDGMKPLYLDCDCGQHFKYMTNITDPEFSYHCLNCKRDVTFELNKEGTAYITKKTNADAKGRYR